MQVVIRLPDFAGHLAVNGGDAVHGNERRSQGRGKACHGGSLAADDTFIGRVDDQQVNVLVVLEGGPHGCGRTVHHADQPVHRRCVPSAPKSAGRHRKAPARSLTKRGDASIRSSMSSRCFQVRVENNAAASPRLYPTTPSGRTPRISMTSVATVPKVTWPKMRARWQASTSSGGAAPQNQSGTHLPLQIEVLAVVTMEDLGKMQGELTPHAVVVIT